MRCRRKSDVEPGASGYRSEAQRAKLHAKIGQLAVDVDFRTRKSRQLGFVRELVDLVDKSQTEWSMRRQCKFLVGAIPSRI